VGVVNATMIVGARSGVSEAQVQRVGAEIRGGDTDPPAACAEALQIRQGSMKSCPALRQRSSHACDLPHS